MSCESELNTGREREKQTDRETGECNNTYSLSRTNSSISLLLRVYFYFFFPSLSLIEKAPYIQLKIPIPVLVFPSAHACMCLFHFVQLFKLNVYHIRSFCIFFCFSFTFTTMNKRRELSQLDLIQRDSLSLLLCFIFNLQVQGAYTRTFDQSII